MKLTFNFFPAPPGKTPVEIRSETFGDLENARRVAQQRAAQIVPDAELIEILSDDQSVRELWVRRDGTWERDDNAQGS
jgi:hypothetical protein